MIGFGYSDKPNNFPYSIMEQADLIKGLLENKKNPQVPHFSTRLRRYCSTRAYGKI